MTKPPKDPIRRYPSEGRVLETNRTNKPRTVERLPDPISAHGDAVVTVVGTNFGDRTSWGPAFRLVLVIPPTFVGPPRVEALTLGNCLTWLEGLSNSLAVRLEEPCTGRLYRMVAGLEGSPNRGWFFTIILDLPKAEAIPRRFIDIVVSSKPKHCLINATECPGLIETTHLLGRLGLMSVLDHVD